MAHFVRAEGTRHCGRIGVIRGGTYLSTAGRAPVYQDEVSIGAQGTVLRVAAGEAVARARVTQHSGAVAPGRDRAGAITGGCRGVIVVGRCTRLTVVVTCPSALATLLVAIVAQGNIGVVMSVHALADIGLEDPEVGVGTFGAASGARSIAGLTGVVANGTVRRTTGIVSVQAGTQRTDGSVENPVFGRRASGTRCEA